MLPSRVWLFAIPWTVACHALPSMGFSRQEYWSGLPFPSPEALPNLGIETRSPALQADALPSEPPGFIKLSFHCTQAVWTGLGFKHKGKWCCLSSTPLLYLLVQQVTSSTWGTLWKWCPSLTTPTPHKHINLSKERALGKAEIWIQTLAMSLLCGFTP